MIPYCYQNEVHVNSHQRQRPFHTVLSSVQSHSVKLVLLSQAAVFFCMMQRNSRTKVPQFTHNCMYFNTVGASDKFPAF